MSDQHQPAKREKYFHVRGQALRDGTVFFQEQYQGHWHAWISIKHQKDQWCGERGRTAARRNFFNRLQLKTTPQVLCCGPNSTPSYAEALAIFKFLLHKAIPGRLQRELEILARKDAKIIEPKPAGVWAATHWTSEATPKSEAVKKHLEAVTESPKAEPSREDRKSKAKDIIARAKAAGITFNMDYPGKIGVEWSSEVKVHLVREIEENADIVGNELLKEKLASDTAGTFLQSGGFLKILNALARAR